MTWLLKHLLLFGCYLICISEKLPDHRKSCKYQTIFVESSNSKTKKQFEWELPEDKREIVKDECHAFRSKRSLITKLPKEPVFRGYKKDEKGDIFNNSEVFRYALRDLLRKHVAHPLILSDLIKQLEPVMKEHMEPYIRLGRKVHYAKCLTNSIIQVSIEVMQPDELVIWKCEDIGRIWNNTYEFYSLTPVWMVENEDGNTFKINLHQCQQKFNKTFCPPDSKVFYNSTCSINHFDSCDKTVMRPERLLGSFSRSLPNGIAVYGTFQKITPMKETTKPVMPHGYVTSPPHPKLYHFSPNDGTLSSFLSTNNNILM